MVNFVITFLKLTNFVDYSFWEIYIKSTLALITYFGAIFTADDILNVPALPQTTNVNEIIRRNFLGFQVLVFLNSILLDNLLIYGQPNIKVIWAHLQTFMKTPSPTSIFADY